MKKVSRFALLGIIIVVVIACVSLTGCDTTTSTTEPTKVEKGYSIEKLTSRWIIIRAEKSDKGYYYYYSESLTKGIKELDRDYEIITIVPITAKRDYGSATQSLLVEVESKYQ